VLSSRELVMGGRPLLSRKQLRNLAYWSRVLAHPQSSRGKKRREQAMAVARGVVDRVVKQAVERAAVLVEMASRADADQQERLLGPHRFFAEVEEGCALPVYVKALPSRPEFGCAFVALLHSTWANGPEVRGTYHLWMAEQDEWVELSPERLRALDGAALRTTWAEAVRRQKRVALPEGAPHQMDHMGRWSNPQGRYDG
jgi:hypothetical protein